MTFEPRRHQWPLPMHTSYFVPPFWMRIIAGVIGVFSLAMALIYPALFAVALGWKADGEKLFTLIITPLAFIINLVAAHMMILSTLFARRYDFVLDLDRNGTMRMKISARPAPYYRVFTRPDESGNLQRPSLRWLHRLGFRTSSAQRRSYWLPHN